MSKLLVVDDEEDIREMIEHHFSLRGFEVVSVADGADAFKACEAHRPDVIILDIKMKKVDGDEVIEPLRKLLPAAKIIAMSASVSPGFEERILSLGADRFVEKSIAVPDLEDIINAAG